MCHGKISINRINTNTYAYANKIIIPIICEHSVCIRNIILDKTGNIFLRTLTFPFGCCFFFLSFFFFVLFALEWHTCIHHLHGTVRLHAFHFQWLLTLKIERPRQKRNVMCKHKCCGISLFARFSMAFYRIRWREWQRNGGCERERLKYHEINTNKNTTPSPGTYNSWQCNGSYRKECCLNIRININYISQIFWPSYKCI